MRNSIATLCGLTLALAVAAQPAFSKGAKDVGSFALLPAGEILWSDVPGFAGVKMAALDGDPGMGAAHFLIKLQDGFAAPLHHHSADHFGTVLSGTLVLTVDGKETKLPAGSFFLFKGQKVHITKCEPGADCVLSIDSRGKWDVIPEGEKR